MSDKNQEPMEPRDKPTPSPSEEIVTDLKILGDDAQELLQVTAADLGEKAFFAGESLKMSLKNVQDKVELLSRAVKDKAETAKIATDLYVRDNPWNAVGIAAAAGFVLGLSLAAAIAHRDDD